MICRLCQSDTFVVDSRGVEGHSHRRRRQCGGCGRRFTTYECELSRDIAVFVDVTGAGARIRLVKPADRGAVFSVVTDAAGLVELHRVPEGIAVIPFDTLPGERVVQLFHAISAWLLRKESDDGIETSPQTSAAAREA